MWNVNTELVTLMKALKGLLNNQALMRVLKSNQCLFSMQPHFHWVLPATTSKENSHLCFPRYSNNHSKYGLEIKVLQVSRTTPGSVTSKKNKATWVNSFYMASGTPMSGLFGFFLLITQEKSHSFQDWVLIKTWILPPALLLAGYKTLKKRPIVYDTRLFIHNSLWFFTQWQAPRDVLRK